MKLIPAGLTNTHASVSPKSCTISKGNRFVNLTAPSACLIHASLMLIVPIPYGCVLHSASQLPAYRWPSNTSPLPHSRWPPEYGTRVQPRTEATFLSKALPRFLLLRPNFDQSVIAVAFFVQRLRHICFQRREDALIALDCFLQLYPTMELELFDQLA